MEQLLSIKSVPVKYELSVTHAQLKYTSQKVQVMEDRIRGGLQIKNRPAKLQLSTLEARNSLHPTTLLSVKQAAQWGMQSISDVTAKYAMEGKQLLEAKPGSDPLGDIIAQNAAQPTGEFQMTFLPTGGADIKYVEPDFQMQYQADKLQFDARISTGNLEYVPGNVSLNVTQWPDVVIEYMGKPMYVPPSAAEHFEASA